MAASKKSSGETPLMKQYNSIKAKHPDAILLFRVGDFYETFGKDAIIASQILGIVLTKRKNGAASHIELAGFPHHSLDSYLPKLVRAGQRVAICDQLEDPKMTKKIVKRGVTELVTPGLAFNDQILENKKNNFLASVYFGKKNNGVAFLDISTGEFFCSEGSMEYIDKLIQGFNPTEVLYDRTQKDRFKEVFNDQYFSFEMDDWAFSLEHATEQLLAQFKTKSLKGFGVDGLTQGITAAGACLQYLKDTQHNQTNHILKISRIEEDHYVWLDRFTVRNLELFNSPHEGAKSLIDIIDHTSSPLGGRTLKRWLALPLKNCQRINQRHEMVDVLLKSSLLREEISQTIYQIGDLERLVGKVAVARINPRETVLLKNSLQLLPQLTRLLKQLNHTSFNGYLDRINHCETIVEKLEQEINLEAPMNIAKGSVIKEGVDEELDELRAISTSSKQFLQKMQEEEAEKTGISSLKIAFNNVFGYYFEVRNTYKDKVPETWIRKQTLVNAERYITEELKTYETKILGAQEKIQAIETRLFNDLIYAVSDFVAPIQLNAQIIGEIDCLSSFATSAEANDYTKPKVTEEYDINILEGRHPVIEQLMEPGQEYVSNNIYLDNHKQQVMMITGPNMSGKSALLRQTALICLMAQIGSFVPAKSAEIGVVDKIFTRVGASDNISMGESTFMVEMNETASILNNLSDRSLILLDEIGRGTSTYDGVSIAWAIAEYIHENQHKAKTLFATHYHELNEMQNKFDRIKNFNVSVKEINNKIIFMRKLAQGGSNHSFGIHVAQMAGMPKSVISRAEDILTTLENSHSGQAEENSLKAMEIPEQSQLSFFQLDDPTLVQIKEQIEATDINTLTPVEALLKLNEIKKLIGS